MRDACMSEPNEVVLSDIALPARSQSTLYDRPLVIWLSVNRFLVDLHRWSG